MTTYEIRTSNGSNLNKTTYTSKAAAFRAARREFIIGAETYEEHDGTTWYGYRDRSEAALARSEGIPASMSITRLA